MSVKVSVVVPVYNPGPHLDDLVASLLRQSLSPDEFEAVFVDDGSTDGTGERLDALAAEHAHFRTLHIPNSGWPGRPRNIGIDAAAGEYVYFVDNDDWIGDEALERLYAMADRNGSDIVIGKMAGHGRGVPSELFRASRDRVTLEDFPALTTAERGRGDPLTPHKLFRKAFLDEEGIRFPEGRRRLEDHVFVMKAYFRARVISILADYVCYHWVGRDDTNASRGRFEPRSYYENVREILDLVEEHAEPGPLRDRLLRNWYRQKMLNRVGASTLLRYPPDYRRALFTEIRDLALERIGSGVVAGLPANLRVRSALLRAGDLERLIALAGVESATEPLVRLEDLRWASGRLVLRVSGRLMDGDGKGLAFARRGEKVYWDPPLDLGADVPLEERDVTRDLEASRIDVLVRSRKGGGEFLLPVESTVVWHEDDESLNVAVLAEASLDPLTSAAGTPLGRDTWDVVARVHVGAWSRGARLGADRSSAIPPLLPAAFLGDPGHVVIPFWTAAGNLSVDVDQSSKSLMGRVTPSHADVRAEDSAVAFALALPALLRSEASVRPVQLHAKRTGAVVRALTVPATLAASGPNGSFARLEARFPLRRLLPTSRFISPGSWKLWATIGPSTKSTGLVLDVGDDGTPSVRSTRADGGDSAHAEAPLPLAERLLFDRSWRRRVPRPLRAGARAALRVAQRVPVASVVGRGRRS